MHRYLLNISYIGTQFRGVQKNVAKCSVYQIDRDTIQGVIELGLKKFNYDNPPAVSVSSRTDSGVHALNSTCHFDLPKIYSCHQITVCLNSSFFKYGNAIRVLKTRLVPQTFHCRFNAIRRTYVYRLAVLKHEYSLNKYRPNILKHFIEFPIEELNRCVFIHDTNFDEEALREAAKLIEGYHDFRTFMSTLPKGSREVNTLRCLDEIKIEKSSSSRSFIYSDASKYFDYWNITFKSRSFLYKQVRRSVGVLLGVAQHKITLQDVKTMLQVPSPNTWPTCLRTMPPHGLYLCNVEYRDADLTLPINYIEKFENSI